MKNLSIFITLTILGLCLHNVQSQSLYMRTGESAFMGSVQHFNQSNLSGNAIGLSASLRGTMDIGISLMKGSMNQMLSYDQVEEYSYAPYINVFWLKQERGYSPINLFSGVQYQQSYMNGNLAADAPLRANSKQLMNTLGIAHNIDLSYTTSIMPTISAQYAYSRMSYDSINDQGRSTLSKNNSINISDIRSSEYGVAVGLPVLIGTPGGSRVIIEPSYAYTNLNQQVTLKVAALLAPNARGKCKGGMCPVFRR